MPRDARHDLLRFRDILLVQNNAQEGRIDVEAAVISNKSQLSEFSHEEVYPSARRTNHFREHSLRYLGEHLLGFVLYAVSSEKEKSPRQPFLTRIEQVVYQILLAADAP